MQSVAVRKAANRVILRGESGANATWTVNSGTETGFYYYGARYLDPETSRWISGDPAMGEYIPQAPINDEAKKHNKNLPGMGGLFNIINMHVYHYGGNNPINLTDPDGNASFSRWFARNWTKLAGIGLSGAEIVSGFGIATGTGVTVIGGALGVGMIIHGSANMAVAIAKITITTVAANTRGDDYADYLDRVIPETAIGLLCGAVGLMVDLAMGTNDTAMKAGAIGDLADIAVGLGLSAAASISLTKSLSKFRTSSGNLISKADLIKLNEYLLKAEKVTAAKIIQGLIEGYKDVDGIINSGNKLIE